jgi:hypothetical protein
MGDARGPRRLIGGANLVPDHLRHHRRAMIGNDKDVQSVPELELAYAVRDVPAFRTGGYGQRGQTEGSKDEARSWIKRGEKLIDQPKRH